MSEREPRARLFIAIDLPEAWKQALADLQQEQRHAIGKAMGSEAPRLRWTRPEGIHLTLKFLGEAPLGRLPEIDAALAATVQQPLQLSLGLGEIGSFGDRRAPRVLHAGLSGDLAALTELAQRIDEEMSAAGYERERRPFNPHLTLARLSDDIPAPVRQKAASAASSVSLPQLAPFTADSVALMRSHLGPVGARYEKLAQFP